MNKNLLAALIIAVTCVLFFMFGMPQYREWSGARASRDSRTVLLADTKATQENLASLLAEYQGRGNAVDAILIALPPKKRYDYLTSSFQAAAEASGVVLSSFAIASGEKKAEYEVIPISVDVSGSYGGFLDFLGQLEHSLRLYDITRISVSSGGSTRELKILLNLTAYSLL